MRAQEFLIEYVREKTAQALGDKLISALSNSRTAYIPDSWYNWQTLVNMALHPDDFSDKPMTLDLGGRRVAFAPAPLQRTPENNIPTAAEVLQQLKTPLVDIILAEIESQDPTTNKEYTRWLARVWANANGALKVEDLNRGQFDGGLLAAYGRAKRRKLIKPEHADINRFKTYGDFERAMMDDYDWDKIEQSEKNVDKGESKEVYRDADVRVIIPEDERAACYYGQGTQWCTASTRNNMFKNYQKHGPLYILLPQKPEEPGEKYQLQFGTNQFMDARDEAVSMADIFNKFPGFKAWAVENIPDVQRLIEFAPDELLAGLSSGIGNYIMKMARVLAKKFVERQHIGDFLEQVDAVANMTPAEIRAAADEQSDPDEREESDYPAIFKLTLDDLTHLPAIFKLTLEDTVDAEGCDRAMAMLYKMLEDHVFVESALVPSKVNDGDPVQGELTLAKVGDWTVGVLE